MKFNERADVSVIIPVYNSKDTIGRAVESVIKQTVLPQEIILIDDCSTDKLTIKCLKNLKDKYKNIIDFKLILSTENKGPGTARNIGWNLAKSKYIAFLDSDDVWHPQKIEIQYNFMKNNNDINFCTHGLVVINDFIKNDFNNFYDKKYISVSKLEPYRLLFKHYSDGTPCIMLKKNLEYRFKEGKKYSEDYLLWLEILFKNKGVLIEKNLAAAFKPLYGTGGLSKNLWKIEKGELETFKILQKKGYISVLLRYIVSCFSFFKFLRRYFIVFFNKLVILI